MWSLLFFYILADDSFRFHETLGSDVADYLGLPGLFGLKPGILGQAVWSSAVGGFFLIMLGMLSFLKGRDAIRFSARLFALVLVLALFAIALDLATHLFDIHHPTDLAEVIEESGEMVAMSVIAWFVLRNCPSPITKESTP